MLQTHLTRLVDQIASTILAEADCHLNRERRNATYMLQISTTKATL
jgi:hypothetical protein